MDIMSETSAAALSLVVDEIVEAARGVDPAELDAVADAIAGAERVFVLGQGRSGIALKAFAMRLMHLGLETHVVGETTSPAVREGDALVVASGSGTTETVVRGARKAAELGVTVIAITAEADSPLSQTAHVVLRVRAAVKTDHGSAASQQYAGSLFEQTVLLVGDAVFQALWQRSGTAAEDLWPRHANLE
ncbi:6-phospho-3-hexuloisomerase [Microbacterium betulae]|uniref:6-phospho-3-hexuloisomerase n=1 Tax=Microbacterium betulae TaxID=2981139 RepID=A0AA97FH51_9MICO|nr:6-phospho-3-hexuloisomerase [Microbacterium sp. AB]WOF23466.1 6-phospho-3-hexuloisomerase [Microbacterium sp. AB]